MAQTIRAVVFKDGEMFIAQALEVDIAAQGKSEEEALQRLRIAIRSEADEMEAEGRTLFDIGPAPAPFYALFENTSVTREFLKAA